MSNKQNLLNMLLFTLDEYSSYIEQLRHIPANQMNDFVTPFSLKMGQLKLFKVLLIYNISYIMVHIFSINSY